VPAEPDPRGAGARRGIRLGECYRFFLPLVLMTELNMISKSVIHAFLARTAEPDVALAAFNTSFAFYYTIASATELTAVLCLSWVDSRAGALKVVRFMALVLSVPVTLSLAVAFTPAGDWLYGGVFGASAAAAAQAREVTWILCLSAPVLILRGVAFALLMKHRRTLFITGATLVRVASLGLSLVLWPLFLDGAAIGGAALVTCMALEAAFAWIFALRHARELPREVASTPGTSALWGFSWPLMLNQGSEIGIVLVVNLFLGRLAQADLALAAFGVVHGLVSLLFSPMRNLLQTTQTLVETRQDARVLLVFSLQLAVVFAVIALVLFNTPLERWVLAGVMGLPADLADYSAPAVSAAFLMAFLWATSALARGLLANQRRTRSLAITAGLRLGTACVVGSVILWHPQSNGALVGLVAWMGAYATEVLVLGWRLRRGVARVDSATA
jgi:O-antigen/teichoic acid export membrane protein